MTASAAIAALAIAGSGAWAQDDTLETVTVTGYRASLESALNIKRDAAEMVDAINAEDIAAFPDSNLAESLQRLPGVSVERTNGEGDTITVRGLNADFTRVTMNGLEALSTAGASASGDDPNRSRKFNFNTFASELFSGLKVQKSAAAETDEGSLGATVALQTARPFDIGNKMALNVQNALYEYGHAFNPRVSAMVSHTFLGGRLGVLASVAYNMRHQTIDGYQHTPSYSDYLYRSGYFYGAYNIQSKYTDSSKYSSYFNGSSVDDLMPNGYYMNRTGMAVPASEVTYNSDGSCYNVVPGQVIANSALCAALTGSNSSAYDTITQGTNGLFPSTYKYKGYYTGTLADGDSSAALTLFPALATLNKRDLYQSKIGTTLSVQAQVNDNLLVNLDAMFASTYQNSTNYQISTVGLNRNNLSQYLMRVTSADSSSFASSVETAYTKASYNSKCVEQTKEVVGNDGYAEVTCNSGDLYDYYSNDGADPSAALDALISMVGKPATKVLAATVVNNQTTYMELADVDLRSAADQGVYTTQFLQGSAYAEYNYGDDFSANATLGYSESRNTQIGMLAEFNHMDAGDEDDPYVYDATGGGSMPKISYPDSDGYSVADPDYWSFVKGYSALRHYQTNTVNKFTSMMFNTKYVMNHIFDAKFGYAYKMYDFFTTKQLRTVGDVYNPSLDEINEAAGTDYTISDLGRTVSFGAGLNVPGGTTRRFYVPKLSAFKRIFGLGSDSVVDYGNGLEGNYQISSLYTSAAGSSYAATFDVHEHDNAYYLQLDWQDVWLFNRELRGNIGMRYVTTAVSAYGRTTVPFVHARASHDYDDLLPSLNLAYSVTDTMLLRAAFSKVMSRPQLIAMSPGITSLSVPDDSSDSGATATATMGNTNLKPFRANTVDFSYEWYFAKGGVFTVAAFGKWVKNVVQQVTANRAITDVLSSDTRSSLASYYENLASALDADDYSSTEAYEAAVEAYMYQAEYVSDDDSSVDVTRYENNKGGVLEGIEITFQQNLTFLPAPFDRFGINANYTLLHSKMQYIIQPAVLSDGEVTQEAVYDYAPWTGASPNSWNVTVYYDEDDWSARVSMAWRSQYLYKYPISTGTAAAGYSDSPVMNDGIWNMSTFNVDAAFNYSINEHVQFRLDAQNLTNQTTNRWAYKYLGAKTVTEYSASGRSFFVGFRVKY